MNYDENYRKESEARDVRYHNREMKFWRQIIIGVVIIVSIMATCWTLQPPKEDCHHKIEKVTVQ